MSEAHTDGRPGPASYLPRPNTVRYNNWPEVDVPRAEPFIPTLGVSVVIPYFEAPEKLMRTLAGLEGQTYPRELFEVVIVDDGSDPPLVRPSSPLDVRIIHQNKRGFGAARTRNNGARAASHDILVFLDGDMIAEATWLAAHARWHHAVSDALTLGPYARVSVEGVAASTIRNRHASLKALFSDRDSDPPWTQRHMVRTGQLTSKHDDLFRAVGSGNLGVGRAFFEVLGGFDESFDRHGGEDIEFGYRGQTRGGLLIPVRDAFAWHQGRWIENRAAKKQSAAIQRAKLGNLIAHPDFRRPSAGRSFAVPQYVVTIQADQPAEKVLELAEKVLADPVRDLVVRIEVSKQMDADEYSRLDAQFAPDPRVRVAPAASALEEFPASPFHVDLPGCTDYASGLIAQLHAALGTAVQARGIDGGRKISITRAWARHRAGRTGLGIQHFGESVLFHTLPGRGAYRTLSGRARRASNRDPTSSKARVISQMRQVRNIRDAWRFAKWLSQAVVWWIARGRKVRNRSRYRPARRYSNPSPATNVLAEARQVRGFRTGWSFVRRSYRRFRRWVATRAVRPRLRTTSKSEGASYSLGVEIVALGKRAQRVFAASSRVADRLDDDRHADVVLVDTPSLVDRIGRPAVVLAENPRLSVPAFDPQTYNPIGWVRNVEHQAVALGPLNRLPPGVKVSRSVQAKAQKAKAQKAKAQKALQHVHHIVDIRDFHPDSATRAAILVQLAATGVPIHTADRDPELGVLLGTELSDLMACDLSNAGLDVRERISVKMRRIVLREHTLRTRARQVAEAALADPPLLPTVSVLLASKRPQCLAWGVANVKKQNYPHIELVVALHGAHFGDAHAEHCLAAFPGAKILRLADDHPFGTVLNAATDAASGTLVAKMDDDDIYAADHIWDLVLALEYSGADIVGKAAETIYLSGVDKTLRRRLTPVETYSPAIAGNSLLLARQTLQRVGGWRRISRHVDRALIDDALRAGSSVYRTHGAGLYTIRHNQGHTWNAADHHLLANAETVHDGWQPSLAGLEDVSKPAFV